MEHINNYINENKDRFINELIELLKIPSISADPTYKSDVLNCAEAVAQFMQDAGADNIEICKTAGYPIVYSEKIIDSQQTIMIKTIGKNKAFVSKSHWSTLLLNVAVQKNTRKVPQITFFYS